MATILAISGGSIQSTHSLNLKALELTNKEHPHVLFIGTATHDEKGYIEYMRNYYQELGCTYDSLELCESNMDYNTILNKFKQADCIYVGGGDTEYMIETWKKYKVDQIISYIYKEEKVFTGISAGSAYWFHSDFADTDMFKNPNNWDYRFVECLDFFPFTFNPHYNEPGRESFDTRIREQNYSGIAMDNDTALLIKGNQATVIKANSEAHVYFIDAWQDYKKQEINEIKW